MAISKPRLQLFVVSTFCVLLIAGAVVYAERQSRAETPIENEVSLSNSNTQSNIVDPSESDAWKEQFIQSKGNTGGTSGTISGSNSTNGATTNEPQTLTDQLGKNFFVNFIALQQKDLLNDTDAVQSVVDNLIYSTALEVPTEKVYSILDLNIVATNDSAQISAYGNKIGEIFGLYSPREDVLDIMTEMFNKNDMRLLSKVEAMVPKYSAMINALVTTAVPVEFTAYHIELTNSISKLKYVVESLAKVETDPALSLYALNEYVIAREMLYNSFIEIKNMLVSKGIIYQPTEPGIIFSTII